MKHFDNDMDELFNKAGQDYPLNTDKRNWEAVHQALQKEQTPVDNTTRNNRYLRYLPLLFLLLVPVFILLSDNSGNFFSAATENKIFSNKEVTSQPAPQTNSNKNAEGLKKNNDNNRGRGNDAATTGPGTAVTPAPVNETTNTNHKTNNTNNSGPRGTVSLKAESTKANAIPSENNTAEPAVKDAGDMWETPANDQGRLNVSGKDWMGKRMFTQMVVNDFRPQRPSAAISIQLPVRISGLADESVNTNTREEHKQKTTRSFYYGVKAGPDLSSIKYQRVEGAGYSAGLLAGYRFSRRFSVELSALWSKKKYYTDGKYFDKTAANIPSMVDIYYLDGGCNMFEFPVAVRYLFSDAKNSFFATAGLNSYFMKKEEYNYSADAGSGVYNGFRKYSNSGKHIVSNFQLSGGYQFVLYNKTNIRIEPYLQLPLRNVGIGKMPITSAGLHLGLVRELR